MSKEAINGDGAELRIARRLGVPGEQMDCSEPTDRPRVFELTSGDFAIIGTEVGEQLVLPADGGCSDTERIVMIPREALLSVLHDLPDDV